MISNNKMPAINNFLFRSARASATGSGGLLSKIVIVVRLSSWTPILRHSFQKSLQSQENEYLFRFFSLWRSNASSISLLINSVYSTPLADHNLGYILIAVKPGIVLISFTYSFSVFASIRKSTRANPEQSTALNAVTAIC